ncbi:hypothetical protein [Robertkochia aurantiaca]|uniref:hypothetical protein n=1 Tax=Robertkochia aurantiaca TaxID=2873700 RepID=UPI001CCABE31|nr:hypothetical protein [Robertkochia sp. 3YJGBD-33]
MNKTMRFAFDALPLLPALAIGLLFMLGKGGAFDPLNKFSTALLIDLLLIIPVTYWIIIRNRKISMITVIPLIGLGIITANRLLGSESGQTLTLINTYAIPLLETLLISVLLFQALRIRKIYQAHSETAGFYPALKQAATEILPGIPGKLLAQEIAVIYYAFFNWTKPCHTGKAFNYHRNNETSLWLGVLLITGIETVVLHLLLARWNETAAWIITAISLYTLLQCLSILRSLRHFPIEVTEKHICIPYGFINEGIIEIDNIEAVTISSKDEEKRKLTRYHSPLGTIAHHNCVLTLRQPAVLSVMGFAKKYDKLLLQLDDPQTFYREVQSLITTDQHDAPENKKLC